MTRKPFNEPRPFAILLPGAAAPANPPFVNWFPLEGAERYRVSTGGAGTWETARNFLTPPVALRPCAGWVTVEALDASGEVLARDARETELPEPIRAVAPDLNALEKRPDARLYLSDEDVAGIRAATGERGAWRDGLLEIAGEVDGDLLAGPPEPAAYPGRVWDFGHWKANNSLCIRLEDAVFALAAAYRISGETRYLAPAVRLLDHAAGWDPLGSTGLWENDHSTQALLHAFSVALDAFGKALPAGTRDLVQASVAARCRDIEAFLNPFHMKELSPGLMGSPANNHAWFVAEAMGLGGLALWDEEPDARDWVALAAQLHDGAFLPYGDVDGGWHEGIDYWSYSLQFLFEFADALKLATGVDMYAHPWLRKTTAFKVLCHPPEGGYVPFGDVKHHLPLASDRLMAMRLASAHADPLEWRYVDALSDRPLDSLRHLPRALAWSDRGAVTIEDAARAEPPRTAFYRDMGWVVSNSQPFEAQGQVLFAFRTGGKHPDATSHNHADVNSLVLCVDGDRLLWDAGYYDSYKSPHHDHEARPSRSHNTLLVDGEGQAAPEMGAFGSLLHCRFDGTDVDLAADASDPRLYGGSLARWVRRAVLADGSLMVEDEVETPRPAVLSLMWHSVFPIAWDPETRAFTVRGERAVLTGTLESDAPVEGAVTSGFAHPPNVRSALLETHDEYPAQFHLEVRTEAPIRAWAPRFRFRYERL